MATIGLVLNEEEQKLVDEWDEILKKEHDLSIYKGSTYNPLPLKDEVLNKDDYVSGKFSHSESNWGYTKDEKDHVKEILDDYLEETLTPSQIEWYKAYYHADLDRDEEISHSMSADTLGITSAASRKRKQRCLEKLRLSQPKQ